MILGIKWPMFIFLWMVFFFALWAGHKLGEVRDMVHDFEEKEGLNE